MNQRIEHLILSHLIHNELFSRKVSPYIRQEYFEDNAEKLRTNNEILKKRLNDL